MDNIEAPKEIIAIIQARMGSTRMPGKTMSLIGGKPLLSYSVNRAKQSKFISKVIVATTINTNDKDIVEWCKKEDIPVYTGSENDVLDRYYQTAKIFDPDYVVRITSDCPLIDPQVIDLVIQKTLESGVDYGSNRIKQRTWPHGLDVEVMKYEALEKAWNEGRSLHEREHVTPYILNHPEIFSQAELPLNENMAHYRLTVDYPEDFELMKILIEKYGADNLGWKRIIDILDENDQLIRINQCRIDINM